MASSTQRSIYQNLYSQSSTRTVVEFSSRETLLRNGANITNASIHVKRHEETDFSLESNCHNSCIPCFFSIAFCQRRRPYHVTNTSSLYSHCLSICRRSRFDREAQVLNFPRARRGISDSKRDRLDNKGVD